MCCFGSAHIHWSTPASPPSLLVDSGFASLTAGRLRLRLPNCWSTPASPPLRSASPASPPVSFTCVSSGRLRLRLLFGEAAGDHAQAQCLVGALEDRKDSGVDEVARHRELFGVPHPAVQLHRLACD